MELTIISSCCHVLRQRIDWHVQLPIGSQHAMLASPRVTPALVSFAYDSQCLRSLGQRLEAPVLGSETVELIRRLGIHRPRRGCRAGRAVQASRCRLPPRLRSVGNGAYLVLTGNRKLSSHPRRAAHGSDRSNLMSIVTPRHAEPISRAVRSREHQYDTNTVCS